MTVPITPGPWSFLQTLGEGVNQYAKNREGKRIQDDTEKNRDKQQSWDRLQFLFKGIQSGDISPNVVKSPLFHSLVEGSGIGSEFSPADITPAPTSRLRTEQGAAIDEVIPTLGQAGRRQLAATGQVPTSSAEHEEANKARLESIKGRVLGQPLTTAQTEQFTGLPSAQTAQAVSAQTQDPQLKAVARRVVRDMFAKSGKLPTPGDALRAGQGDIRAKPFSTQLNEPYYGEAIRELQAELTAEDTARRAAEAKATAAGSNVVKDVAGQQAELRQRMTARQNENAQLAKGLSILAQIATDPNDPLLSVTDKQALAQIQANNEANRLDQTTLDGYGRQAQEVIAPRVQRAGGEPEGSIAQRRNEWDRRAKAIKDNPNDPRVKGKKVEDLIGPRP